MIPTKIRMRSPLWFLAGIPPGGNSPGMSRGSLVACKPSPVK